MAEVSDHAMALLLALARNVPFANVMAQSSLIALRRPSSDAPRHLLPEGEGMRAQ
jgi:lactate dehydrogenase-like 2-hydroxyacid dehydrogenase